jgi:Protein of unknown function (DUF3833)
MKRKLLTLVSLLSIVTVASCSSYDASEYKANSPKLDISNYLNGDTTAHGMIFDWKGKASRHFIATIKGEWEGKDGTLTEHFTYSDGQELDRIWQLKFSDEHNFIGTANDVIGEAVGTQYGNAVNMNYVLRHKETDGSTIDITVDDWLFLTSEGVVINRTKLYKFGIPVGEVLIAFTKDKE